jgi:hypothetical protein
MRILFQLLADWLWPSRRKADRPVEPADYLRPLIVLIIALWCGPEVFAAADLIALLDLLGVMLFLTAFEAGYRSLGRALLTRMGAVLFPPDWALLVRPGGHQSAVAHGLVLIGLNVLNVSVYCLLLVIGVAHIASKLA